MFRHIVMLSFKAPLSARDHKDIVDQCRTIKEALPGIIDLRFVANASDRARSYSHAFVADFIDAAAHGRYQQSPVHAPLKQKVMALGQQLIVLDYET
ncbi:Dabb family protein [Achromobacter denitrificans]|uniref:Dabb family protein n=1 Tax=Achromobacter denitrificans TaxID=32002 RepID=UPI000F68EB33|nr:Dabb family protein [Achromobacter denitrificans]RSE82976.1 Dabb family protein [Achromobacter denitrificans]